MTRLTALRTALRAQNLAGLVIPRTDEYQNEYVPACAERLAWLTGFTGSAGCAVVLADKAALLVDSRYILQAPQEVDSSAYEVVLAPPTSPLEWALTHLPAGSTLGFISSLHPLTWVEEAKKKCKEKGITLQALSDHPVDALWHDRPPPPAAPFEIQPLEFCGEDSAAKRARMAEQLKSAGVARFALTAPDSIAWLLNIRGTDVPHTPLPLCMAILHADARLDLFVEHTRLPEAVRTHLGNSVAVFPPSAFAQALQSTPYAADTAASSHFVCSQRDDVQTLTDPCRLAKACKTSAEQAGTRAAHLRDGAALATLLSQLKAGMSELEVMAQLREIRAQNPHFRDLSFETIAGSGPNGAIVHYRSTEKTNRTLQEGELFLLDSGAQYQDGTTDVTRTVAIGAVSAEMRERFTRVLKGHIALAQAVFPQGTTGHQLDVLARSALWQAGLDYGHGTGHGVGSYLSVHEGPQRISPKPTPQGELHAGMILSNEPGYYKAGAYGIRCENLVLVQPVSIADAEHKMLGFETLTLCPFDRTLIDLALLTPSERDWLNAYHQRVFTALNPLVPPATRSWLAAACAAL